MSRARDDFGLKTAQYRVQTMSSQNLRAELV